MISLVNTSDKPLGLLTLEFTNCLTSFCGFSRFIRSVKTVDPKYRYFFVVQNYYNSPSFNLTIRSGITYLGSSLEKELPGRGLRL